ncbi:nucleotidyl transferase AbiEii/AbiGii toxin family protein [Galbibacter sp. EGI 63066]|uniref:nucleotidyl transferase AbiEii/AbiGii toxin family protein n=1 Tax=Galbibacter sp. EGI 63066 TaxID=2993559 RepID=UPI0022492B73|nr:nucleotidyl transferase AbiEii/AbiGii toxin family protein [Galbibacter sp. EGI 63066]MCX2681051.1 nucleotidyl transferase AbiEii/AbiGii toxin family protein [Galbibacter sp. EGI 63066]
MILQKEIVKKAQEWKVPPDTVDKDYVLGHFLSVFVAHYKDDLVFKGGTCLRKCYMENYRFSEDLDFTALDKNFVLDQKTLQSIARITEANTGIQFSVDKIKPLTFQDEPKGFQVYIKYWGANHSKNQRPLPPDRWHTKIKLEVSTDEMLLLDTEALSIMHPYSDELTGNQKGNCYSITEVVAEKLRALKQRSYTAPRDFYDLYHLTKKFTKEDWQTVLPIFLKKMERKNLAYQSPEDLIDESKLINVKRAWKTSVAHQITEGDQPEADEIIGTVAKQIKTYLPNGK